MRICIDLDNTICFPVPGYSDSFLKYGLATPNHHVIEKLHRWKAEGHHIAIFTARRMLTHSGDVDRIEADVGRITRNWLRAFEVPYDELIFGKPLYDVIIDDLAVNVKDIDKIILKTEASKV